MKLSRSTYYYQVKRLTQVDKNKELKEAIQNMAVRGTIAPDDVNLVLFTDNYDEVMNHIKKYIRDNYKIRKRFARMPWFFEKK